MEDIIRFTKQNNSLTSGQSCLSMITGKPIDQICYEIDFDGMMNIDRMLIALEQYEIKYKLMKKNIFNKNAIHSSFSILFVKMKSYNHFVLYKDGKYYDPEYGIIEKRYTRGKIYAFIDLFKKESR